MVNQLYSDIEFLRAEVRRLRGRLDAISAGSVIITGPPSSSSIPAPVDGALIRGNATPGWERLDASVPAANVRNVVGLDNGDVRPSWKTALDATNPATVTPEDAAAPGTSLVFAHRDHRHAFRTSETDTDKRLAPDGSGGTQWVTGAGGPAFISFGSEAVEGETFSP